MRGGAEAGRHPVDGDSDRRACFDYFRPVTRLSDWIQAFVEDRSRPSHAQDFDPRELFARYDDGKQRAFAFFRNNPPAKVSVDLSLDIVFRDWMQRMRAKTKTTMMRTAPSSLRHRSNCW